MDLNFLPSVKAICPNCYSEIYLHECRVMSGVTRSKVLQMLARKRVKRLYSLTPLEPITHSPFIHELAYRECLKCKYPLPYNIENVEKTITVAIVGDVGSGKSYYLAALLRHIQAGELQSETQYLSFTCLTPDVLETYRRNYMEPLFEQKRVLPPNLPLDRLPLPLIYEINILKSSKGLSNKINLVLYDVSGRDYVDEERLIKYCHFVLHADAILYLVDPLSLPGIPNRLHPHLPLHLRIPKLVDPIITVNIIVEAINQFYTKKPKYISAIPYAVVLSKADLLRYAPLESPEGQLYKFLASLPKGYRKGVNQEHLHLVDREVQKYIASSTSSALIAATQQFQHVHFFATSATGHPPDRNRLYPAIEPMRCPDPLLWILDRLGLIKIE